MRKTLLRWQPEIEAKGILHFRLKTWGEFEDFVREEVLDHDVIWRGQCCAAWPLESNLDRCLRLMRRAKNRMLRMEHLRRFQYSARGRRGAAVARLESENDWWALGQHYGLATPLLDWSTSPYVAAYFAFSAADNAGSSRRAIYHIPKGAIARRCARITAETHEQKRREPPLVIEFVEPLSDDNPRLVSQGGLFTRAPDGMTLNDWAAVTPTSTAWIGKVTLPNKERATALKTLNRMNINHLSLFPDLTGASHFTNLVLTMPHY